MTRLVAAVALAFVMTIAPAQAATAFDVGIANFAFKNGACPSPAGNNVTTIRAGDTVRWTNCDNTTHTVTADNGAFASGDLDAGQTFSRTFPSTGFFYYHCERHLSMRGSVVVENAATTTTKVTAAPATTTTAPNLTTTTTAAPLNTTTTAPPETTTSIDETTTSTAAQEVTITSQDGGANRGVVALLVAGIAAVIGAGTYALRRMRPS